MGPGLVLPAVVMWCQVLGRLTGCVATVELQQAATGLYLMVPRRVLQALQQGQAVGRRQSCSGSSSSAMAAPVCAPAVRSVRLQGWEGGHKEKCKRLKAAKAAQV